MGGLTRSYYGLHRILLGQYTAGGEYLLEDGTEYEGAYHVLPSGELFTESRPQPDSKQLFEKIIGVHPSVIKYNALRGSLAGKYISPHPIQPAPDEDDYEIGYIIRYFVQKRNNPFGTIMEIDVDQYSGINRRNNPGINGVLYNHALLEWRISKLPTADIIKLNRTNVIKASIKFPYLGTFLTNMLEFYK